MPPARREFLSWDRGAAFARPSSASKQESWTYQITDCNGLLTRIGGKFLFTAAGTGDRITLRYKMFERRR